jgi:hypothetical protein
MEYRLGNSHSFPVRSGHQIIDSLQGFSTFARPGTTFTRSYWIGGRKIINEGNLLRGHGNLSKNATKLYVTTKKKKSHWWDMTLLLLA